MQYTKYDLKEKLSNPELFIDELRSFPQTYKTILDDKWECGTSRKILSKKFKRLVKEHKIFKMIIPGTRFGQRIFYTHDKDYYILVEANRMSSKVYCFKSFKRHGSRGHYIKIEEYWVLKDDVGWEHHDKEIILAEGNVLRFI